MTTPDDLEICQLCFGHFEATTLLEYLGLKIAPNKFSNLPRIKTQLLPVQLKKMHHKLLDNSSIFKSLSCEAQNESEKKFVRNLWIFVQLVLVGAPTWHGIH